MKTEISSQNNWVEKRDKLIDEVINLALVVYPSDKEMTVGIITLSSKLMLAEPNLEFINGMLGFMNFASVRPEITASSVLTTLIHDLGEFNRNGHESWFCPRTSSYGKYLTGASDVEI